VTPPPRLAAAVAAGLSAAPPGPVGVAVSGGGDSVALLLLCVAWGAAQGRAVEVVTVDHRLRPESAAEAVGVAALCARLGVAHATVAWAEAPGAGNLQAAAREARRRLIARWAGGRGIGAVALGHTLDDQAETFLLRLARGSGVDGLAGMAAASRAEGVLWLRPLLACRRAELRDWLAVEGVAWIEDPSNADPAFHRARARTALGPLATLGLGPERLAATAARMARARAALAAQVRALAADCLRAGSAGDLTLDPGPFAAAPEEIRLRLLAGALAWTAGARVGPRLASLEAAAALAAGGRLGRGLTLHGCVLRPAQERVAIRREPGRAAPPVPAETGAWDRRWTVEGAPEPGLTLGALGVAGLAARPDWRDTELAREALLTTPALWRDGRLVAAPVLDPAGAVRARRIAPLPPPWDGGELR
jgi:tRNA(Ile)-lysidine synthase